MELKQAQQIMVAQIKGNPEGVIAKAIAFRAGTDEIVAAVRKAPGTVQGVAAAAVKFACEGATPADSGANIVRFMEGF